MSHRTTLEMPPLDDSTLRRALDRGTFGRLEHLTVIHHVPLRQLQSGDVGHFMFQGESRIL